MKYFSNFPVISYNGSLVKNIFARVKISDKVFEYSKNFYPYQMKEKERPDMVAYDYYEDQYNDWLVLMANKVIDPYHGVYLSDADFTNHIVKKYGSISNAQEKIVGYRNNWYTDDQTLTPSAYNALAAVQKKYWAPVISASGSINGYDRAQLDVTVTTNKVISLDTTFSIGNNFSVDEKISLKSGSTFVANGIVKFSNSSITVVHHIEGEFSSNASYTLTSSANTATINDVNTLSENFDAAEVVYYSPYSAYDFENELNESKRNIDLLDNRYSATVERQLRSLLNQ